MRNQNSCLYKLRKTKLFEHIAIKIFWLNMPQGKLTFIGLGLFDEKDISLKGLEEIHNCDKVFAEFYTSNLVGTNMKKIEKKIGKSVEIFTRAETERGEKIINSAQHKNIVFLTAGDPMTATTHIDLRLRAMKLGIKTKIIHASSIITAVPGLLGLQNYKFGRTTTLVFPEKDYFPTSPYSVIKENKNMGLHTLILLDIQAHNNRYMSANEGMNLLLKMEEKHRENIINKDSVLCVVSRAGSDKPVIIGPNNGSVRMKYTYNISTIDPDNDDVFYLVKWGDSILPQVYGPYPSGKEVVLNHTWYKRGTYAIKAKARDIYGAESDWAILEVTVPKNKPYINTPFLRFLENHPRMFPILRFLLGRLL